MRKIFPLLFCAALIFVLPCFPRADSEGGLNAAPAAADTFSGAGQVGEPGRKRAFLVGVHYQESKKDGKWSYISSDVSLKKMAEVLINRMGYRLEDIRILTEQSFTIKAGDKSWNICSEVWNRLPTCDVRAPLPTKDNILHEFQKFLIDQAQPKDNVVIYFIAHGQSIKNVSRNAEDTEECDETIVPYDYVSIKDAGKNLIDDEVGVLVKKLSAKAPGNVTIIFDSCQSATGTRAGPETNVIGGHPLCTLPPKTGREKVVKKKGYFRFNAIDEAALPKGFVFMAAAGKMERAWTAERGISGLVNGEGLFTNYLTETLNKINSDASYRDLMGIVYDKLDSQTPQIEGDVNAPLFGGAMLPREIFTKVSIANSRMVLNAGKFQGITRGSVFELYREGTVIKEQKDIIGKVKVTEVNSSTSLLTPVPFVPAIGSRKTHGVPPKSALAVEIEHNYDTILKIKITDREKIRRLKGGPELLQKLSRSEGFQTLGPEAGGWNILLRYPLDCAGDKTTAASDDVCLVEKDYRGVVMQRKDGKIYRFNEDAAMVREIESELRRQTYYFNLRSLVESIPADNSLAVSIRLYDIGRRQKRVDSATGAVEWNCNRVSEEQVANSRELTSGSNITLSPGDCYAVEIVNTGEEDVYITLFNWEADDTIKGVFPSNEKGEMPFFFRDTASLLSAQTKSLIYYTDRFGATLPLPFVVNNKPGTESLRVIATKEDPGEQFSLLINSARIGEPPPYVVRGPYRSPLERLFFDFQRGTRTGGINDKPGSWAVFSLRFTVLPGGE